jgi:hypothetical protein
MRKLIAVGLGLILAMYPIEAVAKAPEPVADEPPERTRVILTVESPALTAPIIGQSENDKEVERVKELNKKKPRIPAQIDRGEIAEFARQQVSDKWGEGEIEPFEALMGKESGYNPYAQNPRSTAYGIFQFLDGTWKSYGCVKTSDWKEQIRCGLLYIEGRYGSPSQALKFHHSHNWY